MTSSQSVDNAWKVYQDAAHGLYAVSEKGMESPERGKSQIGAEGFDEKSAALIARSEELRNALSTAMKKEKPDRRELAALKLLSAAAHDLYLAGDMLETDEKGASGEGDRGVSGSMIFPPDLMVILNAPLEKGMTGLFEPERRQLPSDPVSAKSVLEDTIKDFLEDIPDDAAALSQTAFSGIISVELEDMKEMVCFAADGILKLIPEDVSIFIRRAARLIVEAINKIREAIGKGFEDHIWKQITEWLDAIQQSAARTILDNLYETKRIEEDMAGLLASTTQDTDAQEFNQATRKLDKLLASYGKTKTALEWTMRILDFVKAPLLNLPPWGPTVVYSTYAGIFGYAVFNGGDYLDWYRLEEYKWLDRVEGLRSTMNDSLRT